MENILIHGLGQNNQSWNKTSMYLKERSMDVACPNLFELTNTSTKEYKNVYNSFSAFCNAQKEKLNLCGLSLGGILALDYLKEHPEKVNSIIIIGTPYKIPKTLFKVQGLIFRLIPKSKFADMGCSKKDFITLVESMGSLDINKDLDKIICKSLILCGDKDKVNMESAKLFNASIKKSDFMVINNSSHETNVDNPNELANIIYGFWKDKQ